jgi:hypothetical protein
MTTTIPQTMQAIRGNVTGTITNLVGAQNQVRALMERPALPTPQADLIGDTLPQMLATVTCEFAATAEAFADLAAFVSDWTAGTMTGAVPEIPGSAIVQTAITPEVQPFTFSLADGVPEPQPLVAPTLAGGLLTPIAITPEPEPEPTPTEEPDGDDESATTADANEANFDKEIAEVAEHHRNRAAAYLNGHVEQGQELATVLASPAVAEVAPEESGSGKRGGRSRKGKKS